MGLIKFSDRCVITRESGERDRYERGPVSEIYSGSCEYQPGAQAFSPVVNGSDTVFLPAGTQVEINDCIEVWPLAGKHRKGIVTDVSFIRMQLTSEVIVRIEFQHSM